ncbi:MULTISPECIES: SDR family oxidoreductase [Streptomyces]|uniref:Dehydrogenase n=1 Tax=Streptomyces canarius TaxID=285453 RepID=A0ABQ3DCF5_9ACTN|nr:SDR family oxidoreductase [Streptomyces canarius]GHA78276.1 dehydrogenase [Streptomyces canarius]
MELENRTIVVTGGGSGIGRAMVERFAKEQPRGLVVVDRDGEAAAAAAEQVGGLAITADLTSEAEVKRVIAEAEDRFGPIDVFVSNAGIVPPLGGFEVPDEGWLQHWNIHVMAHVWAARALVPAMAARGEGYLLNTASAAGLLMSPGAVPYTVTKHAAVALAESLAVLYKDSGVRFSCLCPALVETPLVAGVDHDAVGRAVRAAGSALAPATVADIVVEGLRREDFLILTHPEVRDAAALRVTDPGAYLDAMSGLWAAVGGTAV